MHILKSNQCRATEFTGEGERDVLVDVWNQCKEYFSVDQLLYAHAIFILEGGWLLIRAETPDGLGREHLLEVNETTIPNSVWATNLENLEIREGWFKYISSGWYPGMYEKIDNHLGKMVPTAS